MKTNHKKYLTGAFISASLLVMNPVNCFASMPYNCGSSMTVADITTDSAHTFDVVMQAGAYNPGSHDLTIISAETGLPSATTEQSQITWAENSGISLKMEPSEDGKTLIARLTTTNDMNTDNDQTTQSDQTS